MKKATITDVAQYCGVSIKTVSRVVNNSASVKEETREKVLEAMEELGYQVNLLARGLKKHKTNIIMVFVDRHQEEHMSIWHNVILKYLYRYAKEKGLKIITSPSNGERFLEDETDGFYLLSSGIADGAILLETVRDDKRVEYLRKNQIPYVVFGQPDGTGTYSVSLDNYDVGVKGSRHLVEKGYKNICFCVGEEKFLSTQLRVKGFLAELEGKDITYHIEYGVDTKEKAYQAASRILTQQETDAFFVSGDERAIGVLKRIHELELKIPEDIGILSVDNLDLCEYTYPTLSSIKQDFKELAYECIEMLYKLLEGRGQRAAAQVLIAAEVVERKST